AVEHFLDNGDVGNFGERSADENACHQRERDRHTEIAKKQKKKAHQSEYVTGIHEGSTLVTIVSIAWTCFGSSSSGSACSKPFRKPLTICSIANNATKTPHIGIAAYSEAIGVNDGMRKLEKPRRKLR